MVRSPRRRVLASVALALDIAAIVVLVADAVAAYQREVIGVLVLSAVGIPLALAGAVTSGVHLARSIRRIPRWAVVAGAAVLTIGAVPLGGATLWIASGATPNPAASAAATVGRTVEAAGGHRLCGSGDPGLGPDNTQPYYFALYELPERADVRPRITAQAQQLGWTVSSDPGGDIDRRSPRLQIDEDGTVISGACGEFGRVERASSGMRLLQLEVLLPYR